MYDTHKSAIRSNNCTIPPNQYLSLCPLVHDHGHCALSAGTGSPFNVLVRQTNRIACPSPSLSVPHCPSNQPTLRVDTSYTLLRPFGDLTYFYIQMYTKLPFLVVMGYGLCMILQSDCDSV